MLDLNVSHDDGDIWNVLNFFTNMDGSNLFELHILFDYPRVIKWIKWKTSTLDQGTSKETV